MALSSISLPRLSMFMGNCVKNVKLVMSHEMVYWPVMNGSIPRMIPRLGAAVTSPRYCRNRNRGGSFSVVLRRITAQNATTMSTEINPRRWNSTTYETSSNANALSSSNHPSAVVETVNRYVPSCLRALTYSSNVPSARIMRLSFGENWKYEMSMEISVGMIPRITSTPSAGEKMTGMASCAVTAASYLLTSTSGMEMSFASTEASKSAFWLSASCVM
mmetsp:Transcript_3190/g.13350  ORF Transcript_3190/g.13350 Transcript_3190/m.13350 type:complete len:218 (-) Transcript_3190:4035-4688(-)